MTQSASYNQFLEKSSLTTAITIIMGFQNCEGLRRL
ncbi:unnamed protein product, partial [Vitis vinifera]|uniref:Uncharacterized protein n=1 Tax=Vitis vinifera TaxID=29760 RepID=D7SYN8_VITVI